MICLPSLLHIIHVVLYFVDFIFFYQLLNGLSLWCLLDTRSFLFWRKRLQRRCVHHTFPVLPQRFLHHFHHQRLFFCIHLIFFKVGRHIWMLHSHNFYLTHANEKWRKKNKKALALRKSFFMLNLQFYSKKSLWHLTLIYVSR